MYLDRSGSRVALRYESKLWLIGDRGARRFVHEAYQHGKPIGVLSRQHGDVQTALAEAVDMIGSTVHDGDGVVVHRDPDAATSACTQRPLGALEHHRYPDRD